MTEKQELILWDEYVQSILNATPVDTSETPAQQRKRMERLEADPEAWIGYYFHNEDNSEPAAFHKAATKRITQNLEWYEVRMWSRELAKSTRTMMEVLYLTITGKKKFVVMHSSSNKQAIKLIMPYKANLEYNPRIKHDYGIQMRAGSWAEDDFTTTSGVTFQAFGADQPPRGTKTEKNVRPDVLLFDDIDTDQDCRNPDMIKKKWDWIDQAAIGTRSISKATTIIFCGNRIAVDCCVVRACNFADHVDEINITDEHGNPSWPQKNTAENIRRVLSQKSYAAQQKEYYNNPVIEGSVFQTMSYKPARPISDYTMLVCYTDPSFKDSKKNDYKATVLVGKWRDEFHVIKAYVEQTTTAQMIDWHYHIMDLLGARSCYFLMEQVFLSELIMKEMYEAGKVRRRTIPIKGDKRTKDDKFTRIETLLQPLHANGKLYLNENEKSNAHMKRLDEQFTALAPGSRAHDDGPDAVEGAVWVINSKEIAKAAGGIQSFKRTGNSKRF